MPRAVEEVVDRIAVAAGDDHSRRSQLVKPLGERPPRALEPCERNRLEQVRGHDGCERKEPPDEHLDRVVLEQRGARAGDHHRVDDERHLMTLEVPGNRLDQSAREEHPRLRGVDADVVEHGLELREDEFRRQLVDRGHRLRVLRCQRHEHRGAVDTGCAERLQVGLDAGAAAAVGGRDRQCPRNSRRASLRRHDPDQVRRV